MGAILNMMVRVDLVGKVTFEPRVKVVSHVIDERSIFR